MNTKRNRAPKSRSIAFLGALSAGVLVYIPTATAGCWACAQQQHPEPYEFCAQTWNGFGLEHCASSDGKCVPWGKQCILTIAADGTVANDCGIKGSGKNATNLALVSNNQPTRSSKQSPRKLDGEELHSLEEMKAEMIEAAKIGSIPNTPVDYMRLFKSERREESWASRVESYLDAQLAKLPLAETGLSRPSIRCTSSVCEISVVQNSAAAQNMDHHWQTQFLRAMQAENEPLGVADRAIFTTAMGAQKIGFVTYLLFDR